MAKSIFIHIPKTGGSTLQGIINREYRSKQIYNVRSNRKSTENFKLSAEEKKRIKVLKGHMAFGHHVHFPESEEVTYFTMLRHPVKRLISNYYFILKQKKHHAHQIIIDNKYTLKDYVESGIVANTENAQLRLLSNSTSIPHGQCTTDILEVAKNNIEKHFSIVGINERFDESLLLLQDYYHWRTPYYIRANVSGHGVRMEDLDDETLQTLVTHNSLDLELYEWAKDRFERQVAEMDEKFEQRLKSFRRRNRQLEKLGKVRRLFQRK